MSNKDKIAAQELIIAKAQAEIKELESQQGTMIYVPEMNGKYYIVESCGGVSENVWCNDSLDSGPWNFFNCYETKALATKVSPMMKRSNAIIMACLMVDPDFVPVNFVSNKKAAALLKKWGIK